MKQIKKILLILFLVLILISPSFSQKKVLLINFDAVGYEELVNYYDENSAIKQMIKNGSLFEIQSIFPSNTFPVHTSIATGKTPNEHGIISNYSLSNGEEAIWINDGRLIKTKTIWDAAKEKGLKVASMGWPLTGYVKTITYNQPEIHSNGKNGLLLQLKAGSVFFQVLGYLKYKKVLNENMYDYPGADLYYTKMIIDVLKKGKASLIAMHLTNYDIWTHMFGKYSQESYQALEYLDADLSELLEYVDDQTLVIVFSDHSQLNVSQNIHLNSNKLFNEGYYDYNGGSCFFVAEGLSQEQIEQEKQRALKTEGVQRLLSSEEMFISGYGTHGAFGLVAKEGYYFYGTNEEKAEHGYTLDREHYTAFVATNKKINIECKSVLDVTKIVCDYLELEL